jgi:UDP-glucose 4-epimerase
VQRFKGTPWPPVARVDTPAFDGKRALVTGGAGFIGSVLAHRLVESGADVTIVDSMMADGGANPFNLGAIRHRVSVHEVDVRDAAAMRGLLEGQDYLFNLAARVGHLDSMQQPAEDLEVNCAAQIGILEACRAVNERIKIVHAGTRQVYGRADQIPVAEDHALRPVDVNGIHKLAGDLYYTLYHRVYGTRACVLRLTNTFGPHLRIKDARQTFIGAWIRALVENRPFDVWGGDQVRDLTFVDDAVDAFCAAALADASDGQVFNVGGSGAMPLRQLAALMTEINGGGTYTVGEFPAARRIIDVGDYVADDRKLRQTLNWSPRTPIRDGIAKTLDFYHEHLEQYV